MIAGKSAVGECIMVRRAGRDQHNPPSGGGISYYWARPPSPLPRPIHTRTTLRQIDQLTRSPPRPCTFRNHCFSLGKRYIFAIVGTWFSIGFRNHRNNLGEIVVKPLHFVSFITRRTRIRFSWFLHHLKALFLSFPTVQKSSKTGSCSSSYEWMESGTIIVCIFPE